jgi:Tfp pilus assembly protein PilP
MKRVVFAGLAAFLLFGAAWLARAMAADQGKPAAPMLAQPAGTPTSASKPAAAPVVKAAGTGTVKTPAATVPPASTGADALAQRLAVLRRKVLREEDFTETEESNRDPFRSYLDTWIERGPKVSTNVISAICAKYALEELTLIAVISGDANPRAMFRDPTGLGQTVKRGDYISKSAARITKILSDRVVLEMSEMTPGGETKALERAVLVNPEGTDQ